MDPSHPVSSPPNEDADLIPSPKLSPSSTSLSSPRKLGTVTEQSVNVMEELDESTFLEDLENDTLELDLTHCRLKNMALLKLERFHLLERLSLRQNLFQRIEGIEGLATTLKELDIYDNSIAHIEPLRSFTQLEYLDLSFNRIKEIPPNTFTEMAKLKELFLAANRITHIDHLEGLHQLTNLELGANRIRTITNLAPCASLTSLWLGKNKLTSLSGLSQVPQLRVLSVQSNRLTSLDGLDACPLLEEVYVSHNAVTSLDAVARLPRLRILDVCNNRVARVDAVKGLARLEEMWISHNLLSDWSELEIELTPLPNLHTLYLEGNPVQKQVETHYRNRVKTMLPNLKQLDATFLRD